MNIGPWRLLDQLASDHLGPVHLALDANGRTARARLVSGTLLAAPGATEAMLDTARRLAAAAGQPGIAAVVDIRQQGADWWLFTEHVPSVTARAMVTALPGSAAPDASVVHHVLADSASACLTLHGWGTAHGALSPATVALGEDGSVRVQDPGLLALALQQPLTAAADTAAWATMARTLRQAWLGHKDRYADAVDRAAARAEAGDLRRALDELARGRGGLPRGWEGRGALRAAVAAVLAAQPPPAAAPGTGAVPPAPVTATVAGDPPLPGLPVVAPGTATVVERPAAGDTQPLAPQPAAEATQPLPTQPPAAVLPPGAVTSPAPAAMATVIQRPPPPSPPETTETVAERPAAAETTGPTATVVSRPTAFPMPPPGSATATVAGWTPPPAPLPPPPPPSAPPAAAGGVAFGSGPPASPPAAPTIALPAALVAARSPQPRRRRRGSGILGFLGLLLAGAAIAIVVLVLRSHDTAAPTALTVTAATVAPDRPTVGCNAAPVVFTATLTTNGQQGNITYRWERADGTPLPSGTQATTASTASTLTLTLTDEASGRGRLVETARVHVLTPVDLVSAPASYVYQCP